METIIGIENLNTSEVRYMGLMFEGCSNLTELDVSGFNTANVVDIMGMFEGCSNLTELDVSGFNTASVKEMNGLFSGCSKLVTIDVSGFNTTNVTRMASMFDGCFQLKSLDLSGFNTAKVLDMNRMFENCTNLYRINLSSFNTSSVVNMEEMFKGCSNLTSLDISSLSFDSIITMKNFLSDCANLRKINVGNNDLTNLPDRYDFGDKIDKEKQQENAFLGVGTFDNPCQLIVGPNFNKSVLGVKHDNGKDGFYRWIGGYFNLIDEGADAEVSNKNVGTTDKDLIYDKVEKAPSFSTDDLRKYTVIHSDNVNSGFIIMRVVIEKDGTVTNGEVLKSDDTSLNNTAMERLKSMPKWSPAMQNGKPVRCRMLIGFSIGKDK